MAEASKSATDVLITATELGTSLILGDLLTVLDIICGESLFFFLLGCFTF